MKKLKSQETAAKKGDFLIVGIGASAGGIQALKTFFENVAADSGAAYVVILHLSPDHDSQLAEVLQTVAAIPVAQVKEKVLVEPNRVYVVPPSQHLEMLDGHLGVEPNVSVEERRAPVDIFFRTLAETHQARAVAVVLSGTGANGSMGIKRVKEKGGAAFVQNPREAEFSEMPRNSIATELVDDILNVAEIPRKIAAYSQNLGKVVIPIEPENREEEEQSALREIFTKLRVSTGHDFANYKRPTVLRRIERRINVRELPTLAAYAAYLGENPEEINALLKDLLISVTNFFRDKEAFDYLEREIVPQILDGKKSKDEIRVWIAGCATGEEAYSLAMLLAERIDGSPDAPGVQIFATDIDEDAIAAARSGFYTLNDAADVSPERLRRFFIPEKNGYRVRRELREMILFANHNLLKDPPFSRLDLATCRNLLIYFNPQAQERVMETFHFALKPGAFLFLGTSESIDGAGDLFAASNRELRVFQSRQAAARFSHPVPDLSPSLRFDAAPKILAVRQDEMRPAERISYGDLHQEILEQYAPPSLIVNEQFDIVHVSPNAGRFLQVSGEVSKNLFSMIHSDLRLAVSTAVYQAVEQQINVAAENLPVKIGDRIESVSVGVRPVRRLQNDAARGFLLLIFQTAEDAPDDAEAIVSASEPLNRQLEESLLRSQSQYRRSIEHSELQAEELKAANEELQAMNEELRSATEELETGKEELQSVNEELITVNQELKIKIEELSLSHDDLQNMIGSANIGTIFLDRDFRVKLFTPLARDIFNLIPTDAGRVLSDISHNLTGANIAAELEKVLSDLQPIEREVQTTNGNFYLMQITVYRTAEDRIGGVIIAFVNITKRKQSELDLQASEERYRNLFDSIDEGFCVIEMLYDTNGKPDDWRFLQVNPAFEKNNGLTNATGKTIRELAPDIEPKWFEIYGKVAATGESIRFEEHSKALNRYFDLFAAPLGGADSRLVSVLFTDIGERKQAEEKLRESENRLRIAVEAAEMGTWEWNVETGEVRWNERHFTLFGMPPQPNPITSAAFFDHIYEADRDWVSAKLAKAVENETIFEAEFRARLDNGEIRWMEGYGQAVEVSGGKTIRMSGVMSDITKRRQAEEGLRESEERLNLIIKSVEDYAIITTDENGIVNGWNTGAKKIFGYAENEIVGKSIDAIFTPEDLKKEIPEQEMRIALKEGCADDKRWQIRRDGTRFHGDGVMYPLEDGKLKGFVKILRDMTERLKAEQLATDKLMLQKLVGAQEDERKRIARDLHDELGQLLTALRLKLEAVRKAGENDSELCARIDDTQTLAKRIDEGVDFLAWELRPAALDHLGLRPALEKYVREWSHYAGVTAELLKSGIKKERFAPEAETNLYRIAQESLNNVYKHAEAKSVEVSLEKRGADLIVLIISDDGVGFDTEDKMNRDKGIGLIGMKERAALIGGTLEIESAPGQGTTIYVRVPASLIKRENKDDE